MSDLKFACPYCQQHLEAPEEMLGQRIQCPSCNGSLDLPSEERAEQPTPPSSSTPLSSPADAPQTKACPLCGETILFAAQKCKHCGEFLNGSRPKPPDLSRHSSDATEVTLWSENRSILYYIPLIIVGIILIPILIGILLILYAVLDQRYRVFTLTNRRVLSQWGIISRHTREVAIQDIRTIKMSQGILERIFGLGSIAIGSAGTAGIEVTLSGVTKPNLVRDLVRKKKDESL